MISASSPIGHLDFPRTCRVVSTKTISLLLIEKWDEENNFFDDVDPIALLHSLMEERGLKAKDLVEILGVSKGLVSDILNYKKGLSKDIIRSLADYFKVSQEAFNIPYQLSAS